jgi:class 3 adenylate cyclase
VAVWDGGAPAHPAGTAVDIETWRATGRPTHVIPSRRDPARGTDDDDEALQLRTTRALLFADIAGFSRLRDGQITQFMDSVMAELARCIDGYPDAVLLRRSWGDGIYVVFADTSSAAGCALAMQDSMRRLDLVALGLDAIRGLRIGAHVGPVFEGFDAVGQERNFFGADVTKAARIEPRTPEGEVFVTAPFAALVQLEGDRRWSCQYVGNVPTAKDYGVLPMYVLKRRT